MSRASKVFKTFVLAVFFFAAAFSPYLHAGCAGDSSAVQSHLTEALPKLALGIDATQVFGILSESQRRDMKTCWEPLAFLIDSSRANKSRPTISALDYQRDYNEPAVKLWLIHGSMLR